MKICPNCQQTYDDDDLNFCLNDGGILKPSDNEPPPTVMINQARSTSPNVGNDFTQPISPWQTPPPSPMQPFQQQTPAYMQSPVYSGSGDQTLPIVSLALGSLSAVVAFIFCVFGAFLGLPLGIAAVITGYMGINNANKNPQKYTGKNVAIGGLIVGGIGILISLGWLLLMLIGAISDKN